MQKTYEGKFESAMDILKRIDEQISKSRNEFSWLLDLLFNYKKSYTLYYKNHLLNYFWKVNIKSLK